MAKPNAEGESSSDLRAAVDHVKGHWLVYGIGLFFGVLGFLFSATDTLTRAGAVVSDVRNPHAEVYATLETLDLDTRLAYFEDNFGTAKSVFDLCENPSCPEPTPGPLLMYIHETDDLAVRAVFEGDQLEMYLVTLMSPTLNPPIEWLGYDLGRLGEVTLAEAIAEASSEPTDTEVFLGAQAAAYAEVTAVGAPGNYRGLVLAWAPEGWAGPQMTFDRDAAQTLSSVLDGGGTPEPAVLASFRSGTTPNTYGEFRDDGGYVSTLVHDADNLVPLLFVGTER